MFIKNKTKYDVRAVSMVITSLMILILGLGLTGFLLLQVLFC